MKDSWYEQARAARERKNLYWLERSAILFAISRADLAASTAALRVYGQLHETKHSSWKMSFLDVHSHIPGGS